MAYKQKGFPKPRKNSSPMQSPEKESLDRYKEYRNQMQREGRGKFLPKLSKVGLGAQLKWWKFGRRWDSTSPQNVMTAQLTLEQRAQHRMGEELYTRAFRLAAPSATTSGYSPQGAHFEAVFNSPQFQQFMRNEAAMLKKKGGDASMLNFDLSKGYSWGVEFSTDWMGKERLTNDGKIHFGKDIGLDGAHESVRNWKKGKMFREQSDTEKEQYTAKTGKVWGETGMEQLKRYEKFFKKSEDEGGLSEEDRQSLGNPTDEEIEKLSDFIQDYMKENDD